MNGETSGFVSRLSPLPPVKSKLYHYSDLFEQLLPALGLVAQGVIHQDEGGHRFNHRYGAR